MKTGLFPLGRAVATAAVCRELPPHKIASLLSRHRTGDWGGLCDADRRENESALLHGERLLSAYQVDGRKVYVITEADRSYTTVLFADEY